jgi:hypothetical protein
LKAELNEERWRNQNHLANSNNFHEEKANEWVVLTKQLQDDHANTMNFREKKNISDLNGLKKTHVDNIKETLDKHRKELEKLQSDNLKLLKEKDDQIKKLRLNYTEMLKKKNDEIQALENEKQSMSDMHEIDLKAV